MADKNGSNILNPVDSGKPKILYRLAIKIGLTLGVITMLAVGIMILIISNSMTNVVDNYNIKKDIREAEAQLSYIMLNINKIATAAAVVDNTDSYIDAIEQQNHELLEVLVNEFLLTIPNIDTLVVTDNEGTILAADNSAYIGKKSLMVQQQLPFEQIEATKPTFRFTPVFSYLTGKRVLPIAVDMDSKLADRTGYTTGYLEIAIAIDTFSAELVSLTKNYLPEDEGFIFILNNDYEFVSHPDGELLQSDRRGEAKKWHLADEILAPLDFSNDLSANIAQYEYVDSNGIANTHNLVVYYVPSVSWYFCVSVLQNVYQQDTISIVSSLAVICSVMVFFILIASVLAVRLLVIHRIADFGKSIQSASGGDMTSQAPVKSFDELGLMGGRINLLLNTLNRVIADGKSLNVGNRESIKAVNLATEINKETVSFIRQKIANTEVRVGEMREKVGQVTGSSQAVQKQLQQLVQQTTLQRAGAEKSLVAVEQMDASINSVADIAQQRSDAADNLLSITAKGENSVNVTNEVIENVAKQADDMLETIRIINSIASQTNLLAMNASIEAAHAGEAGRGFAVVADEIRKLSTTTSNNAGNITSSLNSVIEKVNSAKAQSEESNQIINLINSDVKQFIDSFVEISNTTKELTSGSAEIMQSVLDINKESSAIAENSKNSNQHMGEIIATMEELNQFSDQTEEDMKVVATLGKRVSILTEGNDKCNGIILKYVRMLDEHFSHFKIDEDETGYRGLMSFLVTHLSMRDLIHNHVKGAVTADADMINSSDKCELISWLDANHESLRSKFSGYQQLLEVDRLFHNSCLAILNEPDRTSQNVKDNYAVMTDSIDKLLTMLVRIDDIFYPKSENSLNTGAASEEDDTDVTDDPVDLINPVDDLETADPSESDEASRITNATEVENAYTEGDTENLENHSDKNDELSLSEKNTEKTLSADGTGQNISEAADATLQSAAPEQTDAIDRQEIEQKNIEINAAFDSEAAKSDAATGFAAGGEETEPQTDTAEFGSPDSVSTDSAPFDKILTDFVDNAAPDESESTTVSKTILDNEDSEKEKKMNLFADSSADNA